MHCDGVPDSRRAKTREPWEEELARWSIMICSCRVSMCEDAPVGEGLAKAFIRVRRPQESENGRLVLVSKQQFSATSKRHEWVFFFILQ